VAGARKKVESKQLLWQRKAVAEGRCPICGRPRGVTQRCERCRKKAVLAARKRLGCKPWRPGGTGRPPKGRGSAA
jgi:predicted RNA-binding Zn-ribbon protein involved in translation (DUF1610 family)